MLSPMLVVASLAEPWLSSINKGNLEFLTAEGCTAANIHGRLKKVYGEERIDVIHVRRSVNMVKGAETSVEDKPRSGRSVTVCNRRRKNE